MIIAGTEAISITVVYESKRMNDDDVKYFNKNNGDALKSAFDEVVLDWPDVTATTMFGCPSYQAEGTLFAVLVTDGVALTRLPSDHRERPSGGTRGSSSTNLGVPRQLIAATVGTVNRACAENPQVPTKPPRDAHSRHVVEG